MLLVLLLSLWSLLAMSFPSPLGGVAAMLAIIVVDGGKTADISGASVIS
jgi:hypothetical protein